jgi:AcrR family transcriptional regulator
MPPESDQASGEPPPNARRPRRSSDELRRQILEAAKREFMRAGFDGTTVRQIAAAADVNDAILYRYFHTKEQIFEEAVAAPLEHAVRSAFTPAIGDAEIRAVSETFIKDLLDGMQEIAPLLVAVLGDADRGQQFYRERFTPALALMTSRINENLDQWAHIDFDPDLAFRAVFGMCLFVSLEWRFGTAEQPPADDLAPALMRIIWDGLRSRPDEPDH